MSGVRFSAAGTFFSPQTAKFQPALSSMQSDIYQEVISFFKTYFPHSSPRVCVAVSGGGDSVALFHILKECASQIPLQKLGIIHVNHHLRGKESNGDAELVKKLACHAVVDFYCKDLRPPFASSGLEEWGRKERYAFFSQIIEKTASIISLPAIPPMIKRKPYCLGL